MRLPRGLSLLAILLILLVFSGCTVGKGDSLPVTDGMDRPILDPGVSMPAAPGQALLVRGSESVRGVAGFGRNAIPALYGEYALQDSGGELQRISVWYTRQNLLLDEGWTLRTCPGLAPGFTLAQSGAASDGLLMLVASAADYRIVIRLSASLENPCRFIVVLLERFSFFMSNAAREEDLSFPAFLQL